MASSSSQNKGKGKGKARSNANDFDYTTYVSVEKTGRTAEIWQFFDLMQCTVTGHQSARCQLCHKYFILGSNSTLAGHRRSCLTKFSGEAGNMNIGVDARNWVFDEKLCRELTMKCTVQMGLPFSMFDNKLMTTYIQTALQPRYRQVSRHTLRRDALLAWKKAYKDLQTYFLNFNGKVSLTSDVWSAGHGLNLSYLCITAHWIDPESWEMCKRTISFEPFEMPHNAHGIYTSIMSSINEYNLSDKILSISFDNASNNTAAIAMLQNNLYPFCDGKFFHTRCACHILNLVVQDGLKYCDEIITKFRNMIVYIYQNPKRSNEFRKYCKSRNEKFLKPEWDMPVRWNSTYKMLRRCRRQRNVLLEFYTQQTTHLITNSDWDLLDKLLDILEVFYTATVQLSGVYYPTSPHVLSNIYMILLKFATYKDQPIWCEIINVMLEKLLKYYGDLPAILTCSAALNPIANVGGVFNTIDAIRDILIHTFNVDPEVYPIPKSQDFEDDLKEIFQYYKQMYSVQQQQNENTQTTPNIGSSTSTSSLRKIVFNTLKAKKHRTNTSLDELGFYQSTNMMAFFNNDENIENFDILSWWKKKQDQFPIMAALARDVLTVQASTVASESAFSLSGRILNERRTRLSPIGMVICICLKDYYDAQDRAQDHLSLEDSLINIEDELIVFEGSNNGSPTEDALTGGDDNDQGLYDVDDQEYYN